MKRSLPVAASALAVVVALAVRAQPSSQSPADPAAVAGPGWTIDVDLAPRPGPARGPYRMVAAVRDAAGGRLQTLTLEVARGQEARSERPVPGGGTFSVQVSVDGGGDGASWSAEVRRGESLVLGQRARVQLRD